MTFFIVSRKYSYLNIYLQLNIEILIIIWKKGTLNLKLRFLLLKKDKESQNNNNDLSNFVETSLTAPELVETSVCRFKSQSYISPSSGISVVWRADSWRRRNYTPFYLPFQTMEMPLDGDNTKDS